MMDEKQSQKYKTISVASLIGTDSPADFATNSKHLTKSTAPTNEPDNEKEPVTACQDVIPEDEGKSFVKEHDAENVMHNGQELRTAEAGTSLSDENDDVLSTPEEQNFVGRMKSISSALKNAEGENGQRISLAEATVDMLKNNPNVTRAIGTGYRRIKKTVQGDAKKQKKTKRKKITNGYSQDAIPIKSVQNGIIQTTSGMFIKILEVLPINFYDMSVSKQSQIANTFASLFHEGPSRVHLKCITDKNNPARMIAYIKQKCEEEKWQRGVTDGFIECAGDLIRKIRNISDENTISKRYFFIYRYEGNSYDSADIFTDMETTRRSIMETFSMIGNPVIDVGYEKSSFEAGEILYYMLNRKTCRKEFFTDRINRIVGDIELYNNSARKKKDPLDVDFIAPKGLVFSNHEYVMIDGQYVTYFALKDSGHPFVTYIGWLDNILSMCEGLELDIYVSRKNHDTTVSTLSQYTRVQSVSLKSPSGSSEKKEILASKIENNSYIVRHMNNEEDLFDVMIIITLRADTIQGLRTTKQFFMKQLSNRHLKVEDAYANTQKFFQMSLPLFEVSSDIFNRNKRNYLTSSLGSLYMFTAFEFNDYTGVPLGQNALSGNFSLAALNFFNTEYFSNANISILGQTGAGKTYSLEVIARAMRITGIRVFMILPIKGHEAYRGCRHIGGSYIHLYPGSEDRLNICEIRPAINIDKDVLTEDIGVVQSLLANQIAFLMTWINLNITVDSTEHPMNIDERVVVEAELYAMYSAFEITHDNDSIYERDGTLKHMPVIGDIYDRLLNYPELRRITKALEKYVTGSCKNMNGQTNVDLTNKFIVFFVDSSNMPKEMLAPFLFATIKCTYNLAQQSRLYKDMIIIDEAWNILKNQLSSEMIFEMVKIIRGYGGGVCITTQDVNDLLNDSTGKAIISGTAVKLIMYLEETEANLVADTLGLTKEDVDMITSFKRGQALLLTRQAKIYINILASDMDDRDFTTDPNKLRRYAEEEAAKKAGLQSQ